MILSGSQIWAEEAGCLIRDKEDTEAGGVRRSPPLEL